MAIKRFSIIIPLYNVENYISVCIESVLHQSYTDFEVIVVNDGSTDSSPNIVKKLMEKDHRVRLIDQKNAGVSVARNTGLANATGEYIVFVDADDFLASDFLEYMVGLCQQSNADFCLSENAFTRKGEKQIVTDNVRILNSEQAIALLLSPRIIVGCWNKVYRHSFLKNNNITFSSKLFYGEGLDFITRVADKANSICVGDRKVYFYRRSNEASATTSFSIAKMHNGDCALDQINNGLTTKSKIIDEMLALHKGLYALGAITKIINNRMKKRYKKDYKLWKKKLGYYARKVTFSRSVSMYRKCMLWSGVICPSLMAFLDSKRRKKIATSSFQ